MTTRRLAAIVKHQKPLVLTADLTARAACRAMWTAAAGSALVVDERGALIGIFTGRDAVRCLAGRADPAATRLGEAMTRRPLTATPETRVIEALRIMEEGGFRHLPVIEAGAIKGVVSRNDFLGMEIEELLRLTGGGQATCHRCVAEVTAGRKPVIAQMEASVRDACRTMLRRKAGSVLVVDRQKRLKGIFTGRDAVRALARSRTPADVRVAGAMTRNPVSIDLSCSATAALEAMEAGGFRHLPVICDGAVCGVVSRRDFTGLEIDRLDEEERLRQCIW